MADEHDSWLKSALGVDVGDTLQKIEDAGSSAISSATSTVASAASTALDAANTAGNAVMSAESTAWDGTKKAYGAVTGAYDAVAPNFTKANQDLGNLVDAGEAAVKKGKRNGRRPVRGRTGRGLGRESLFVGRQHDSRRSWRCREGGWRPHHHGRECRRSSHRFRGLDG